MTAPPSTAVPASARVASDLLSDVLHGLSVIGSVQTCAEIRGPWALEFLAGEQAVFHVVHDGDCWLVAPDGRRVRLGAGDFVLCRRGLGHVIGDSPDRPPVWRGQAGSAGPDESCHRRRIDGDRPPTVLVCGGIWFEEVTHPLLDLVPDVLVVRSDTSGTGAELATATEWLAREAATPRPGGAAVVRRLAEVAFVTALRAWLEEGDPDAAGGTWRAAAHDPHLARAMSALHREPGRPWSVSSLATEAAMSRSRFAFTFQQVIGMSPMRYVTRVRVHAAAQALRQNNRTVPAIAADLGYRSPAAFARLFRRETGTPPGEYRRRHQQRSENNAAAAG